MKKIFLIINIGLSFAFFLSCGKETEPEINTDKEVFDLIKSVSTKHYFYNSDALLQTSDGSGHAQPFLRVWYNDAAAGVLGSDGRILENISFPDGSLVVKELFKNETELEVYAILYKSSLSPDADAKSWVWAYLDKDGNVLEPAANKGNACISCHLQSGNIDYMLMNKYFP